MAGPSVVSFVSVYRVGGTRLRGYIFDIHHGFLMANLYKELEWSQVSDSKWKEHTQHTIFVRFDLQITFCTSPRSERPKPNFKNGSGKRHITKLPNSPCPNLPPIGVCPRHHPSQQTPHAEREIWYGLFIDQTGVTLTRSLNCYLCSAPGAKHLRFIDYFITKLSNYCSTMLLPKLSLTTLVWHRR